jgi:cysteinyl-tRNA synthetase
MLQGWEKAESANSSERAKKLAVSIISRFEENMDNNLDVKGAFDELFSIISALHGLKKQGKLSLEEANAAIDNLKKIDSVLQIIF